MLPNQPIEHLCAKALTHPARPANTHPHTSHLPPHSRPPPSLLPLCPALSEHEYRSVAILRHLVAANGLEDRLPPDLVEDIGALISASSSGEAYRRAVQRPRFSGGKRFLVDIVANFRNSALAARILRRTAPAFVLPLRQSPRVLAGQIADTQ